MTPDDIIDFVTRLKNVVTVTASEANGAPEAAWGDSFFYYDPDGTPADRRMPFATIVVHDYEGFDTASDLDRPGVFRLNVAAGRAAIPESDGDPTALDTLIPHPVYASQGWVAILNPAERTAALARSLLTDAHARAARRHDRRTKAGPGDPAGSPSAHGPT
jgi:hypothetical protein